MSDPTWISILPPVLAIGLAIATRQVYLSLAAGIWLGTTILAGGNPATGLADGIERMVAVLGSPGDARVVVFTLVIGALIATIEASGGVRGFVQWLEQRKWVDSPRRAQFLAWNSRDLLNSDDVIGRDFLPLPHSRMRNAAGFRQFG